MTLTPLRAIVNEMRHEPFRHPEGKGRPDVVYASRVDEWADRMAALLDTMEGAAESCDPQTGSCRVCSQPAPPENDYDRLKRADPYLMAAAEKQLAESEAQPTPPELLTDEKGVQR